MKVLVSNTTLGYAIIMGAILIGVSVYTLIKIRKQVKKAKKKERKQEKD